MEVILGNDGQEPDWDAYKLTELQDFEAEDYLKSDVAICAFLLDFQHEAEEIRIKARKIAIRALQRLSQESA